MGREFWWRMAEVMTTVECAKERRGLRLKQRAPDCPGAAAVANSCSEVLCAGALRTTAGAFAASPPSLKVTLERCTLPSHAAPLSIQQYYGSHCSWRSSWRPQKFQGQRRLAAGACCSHTAHSFGHAQWRSCACNLLFWACAGVACTVEVRCSLVRLVRCSSHTTLHKAGPLGRWACALDRQALNLSQMQMCAADGCRWPVCSACCCGR